MLMMYWPKTRWGQAGGGPSVYFDDVKAFKLPVNHYTWIYVPAGRHTFSTMWGFKIFGLNPLSGLNMKKDIPFEEGHCYYLRMRNWMNNYVYAAKVNVAIDLVNEQTAKKEAGTCWFSKPLVGQIDGAVKQSEKH